MQALLPVTFTNGVDMADDPKKKKVDRKKVSQQKHEVDYLVKTTRKPAAEVKKAIKDAGPGRAAVKKALK